MTILLTSNLALSPNPDFQVTIDALASLYCTRTGYSTVMLIQHSACMTHVRGSHSYRLSEIRYSTDARCHFVWVAKRYIFAYIPMGNSEKTLVAPIFFKLVSKDR